MNMCFQSKKHCPTVKEKHGAHAPASTVLRQLFRGWSAVAQHAESLVAVR